jgi:predicted nucleic acid-binding protein
MKENGKVPQLKFVIDSNVWINAFHCEEEQLMQHCNDAIFTAKEDGAILGSVHTFRDLCGGINKIIKAKGFTEKQGNIIIDHFIKSSILVEEKIPFDKYATEYHQKGLNKCRDKDDWRFLSLAHQYEADFIVTCDWHLNHMKNYQGIKILTPNEFINEIESREQDNTEKLENSLSPETDELLKELKADFEEKYRDFWKKNQEGKLTDIDFHEVYYAAASVIQREVIVNGVSREEALAKHKYEGEYVKSYEAKRELNSKAKVGRESSVPTVEPVKKGPELPKDAGIVKSQNKTNDKGSGSGGGMSM